MVVVAMVFAAFGLGGCVTSSSESSRQSTESTDLRQYLSLDVLVVDKSEEVVQLVDGARQRQEFKTLFGELYQATKEGGASRAAGCVPVVARFQNLRSSDGFRVGWYPDIAEAPVPVRITDVTAESSGTFQFEACDGRASLLIPREAIGKYTAVEVSTPVPTYYPYEEVGKADLTLPGLLYSRMKAGMWHGSPIVLNN